MNDIIDCFIHGSLFLILFFCAFRDWKEGIIPNRYLMRGIEVRVFLLLFEVWLEGFESILHLLMKAFIGILIFLGGILIRKMTGNGLGIGDIKLFSVMALYLSAREWIEALFYSCIFCMTLAFGLFCIKKPRNKFPFAPAVFLSSFFIALQRYVLSEMQ